jgi:peptide/nickel transport system substrate-binding protein
MEVFLNARIHFTRIGRTVASALLVGVLVTGVTACGPAVPPAAGTISPTEAPRTGGGLVYGLTLAPSGIDPHVHASSELGIPLRSVYDTLIYKTPDGDFVPGLARAWEISGDDLVYTFHLRQGVTFHDGTPCDAKAVKLNLDRIVDPATKSQRAVFLLGPYQASEVVDDLTIQVRLKEPYAPLLDGLSQVYLGIASPTALQKWGPDYELHQVGTGPFIFKEYIPRDHLTLIRNPAYNWAPAVYDHPGPAYLDEIQFRFFTDPAARALALEAGEADVMGEIPPQDARRLKDAGTFQLIPVAVPGQSLEFVINTARPPTDDLRVRQALLYAVDRSAIVQAIFGGLSPVAYGPLGAVTLYYDRSVETMYPHDAAKAAALLDEAGWRDSDGDGIRDKWGQALVLETYIQSWGYSPEVAQLVQGQLRQVGVGMDIQMVAYPAALEAARQGKHHLIISAFSGSDPDILRTYFHSSNAEEGFNWAKVRDAELDRLLEEGSRVRDPEQRRKIYAQVQERIMNLALIIPLRDYVNLNVARARVKGLRYDAHGWFPLLHDVYIAF